jgi:ATP-dependent Lhr-like helicase
VFAGRVLEYVRTQDMAAYVRLGQKKKGVVPAWAGGKMPLSSELADAVRALLDDAAQGDFSGPEMNAAGPMLQAQMRLSHLPRLGRLLVEQWRSREGHHLFIYPFAGRNVHIGLAQLLAWRLARDEPNTFSLSVNDYGLEILAAKPLDLASALAAGLLQRRPVGRRAGQPEFGGAGAAPLSRDRARGRPGVWWLPRCAQEPAPGAGVQQPVLRGLSQVRRRQPAAGPGAGRSAVAGTGNPAPDAHAAAVWPAGTRHRDLPAPSPFALPLMVERLREQLSTEKLKDRLDRMLAESAAVLDRPSARLRRARP